VQGGTRRAGAGGPPHRRGARARRGATATAGRRRGSWRGPAPRRPRR